MRDNDCGMVVGGYRGPSGRMVFVVAPNPARWAGLRGWAPLALENLVATSTNTSQSSKSFICGSSRIAQQKGQPCIRRIRRRQREFSRPSCRETGLGQERRWVVLANASAINRFDDEAKQRLRFWVWRLDPQHRGPI